MRAKRILLVIAGVFNCLVGALAAFFSLMILLLNKLLRTSFETSSESMKEYIDTLASADESYAYLKTATSTEVADFLMRMVNIVGVVFFVLAVIWIGFGVINLLLSTPHRYYAFDSKKALKVLLIIGSWVLMLFNIANILTTIAICLKIKKDDSKQNLYSVGDSR